MTDAVVADAEPYICTHHKHSTVFHSSRDCCRIQKPGNARERSARYVNWHELEPCEYCHD